ncbi:Beta-N-acetylglucosaminidase/beta-glucosidase [Mannheimia haemolytica]|nr:hypothetical protein J450_06645 [Mannheimia haemolytica D171]
MAGHIHLPAYEQHFNPNLSYEDCLPATLSKPILTDLLRGKLGFNGVVVTDASHMVAMTSAMKRSEMLPKAIAAGCDLFLFFNDPDEDFDYMMAGYKNGIITEERLNDALTRILGLKAKLGLHNRPKETLLEPKEQALAKIGLPEHKVIFRDVADKAITLVKNKQDILPINVERFPRVLLVNVKGTDGGFGKMVAGSQRSATEILKEKLAEKGFTVSIYTSPMDNILKMSDEEQVNTIRNEYSQKRPITTLTDHYDLIINVANVQMSTVQRIVWQATKGTPDIPFYVHEVPTIFVSVQCPFHLVDVPQVKTYINAYDGKEPTIELLVEKLMGNSEFKGVSPVDAFCGYKDTHI